MTTTHPCVATLDAFLASPDFESGVIASTKAGWSGSGYSVELFEDGTYRTLWNNQIGNKYDTPGVLLALPTLPDDIESDEDAMHEGFLYEQGDLAQILKENLHDILLHQDE